MAQYTSIYGAKLLITVLAFGFFAYILVPPLYWHFVGDGSGLGSSCPPCLTECPEDVATKTALLDLRNVTPPVCPKIDTDMADELQKTQNQKLQEEMKLQKSVAEEAQQKSDAAFLEAKKTASQAQKDFEKCNLGMTTSEGAREKAEKSLAQMKKIAALWETRAKELGWTEEKTDTAEDTKDGEESLNSRETEETSDSKPMEKTIPTSRNGPQVTAELHQNLAVGHFIVQRAVDNEMASLKGVRQHAVELDLL